MFGFTRCISAIILIVLSGIASFLRGRTDTYSLFTAGCMNGIPWTAVSCDTDRSRKLIACIDEGIALKLAFCKIRLFREWSVDRSSIIQTKFFFDNECHASLSFFILFTSFSTRSYFRVLKWWFLTSLKKYIKQSLGFAKVLSSLEIDYH